MSSEKKIAILQSNYIPWKGYFDFIASVDEFILFDDMQYTRRDWRNRNQIKTPQGIQWITIPVMVKGKYYQKIRDTEIDGDQWPEVHWKTLFQNYRRSRYFNEIAYWLEPLYRGWSGTNLSKLNRYFIEAICKHLGIHTKITNSWDYPPFQGDNRTERLAWLCSHAGGTEYISGPSAKDYVEENILFDHGIKIKWADYSGYPIYNQLWGDFVHGVSILDLLFNCGNEAKFYMKYVR
ncbi:WbqC-like protein family protein [mine drainage metagenome]|uniref:WbqC-like protein family protein n=1 Tax=mine drainage metagenome TaxID=410659 RepID=A0A1J5RL56_9ZZZZ